MIWSRGCFGVVLVGLVLVTQGCEGEGDVVASGGGVVADEAPVKIRPKWKLPGDFRIPGKADSYDDYRKAHPQWYALTVPPDKAGLRTATEWQDMRGVLLGFPGSQGTSVNNSMAQMVVQGADYVDWYVVVPNVSAQTTFVNILKGQGMSQATIDAKVHFLRAALDSIWMVDYGPFPLVAPDGSVAFTDFRYYHQRIYDDAIPTRVGNALGVTTYRAGMDYEGGNFQMDEVGTCYLSQGAYWENPDKSTAEVNDTLARYLGCKTFVVLAPLQDGTTHIDMFSKLVSKNVFVLGNATTKYATQTTVNTLEQDFQILQAAVLADGSKLTIHRIPMPYQKDSVWRTYTNSTFANGVNLWPIYSINKDLEAEALNVWKAAMPDWDHVGINSDTVITWGGAMHCVSRALPAGTYSKWVADGTCSGGTCQAPAGGYDGTCTNNANCVGPKWLCPLPDCGSTPVGCGGVTWEGCCEGETLKYCEDDQLKTLNCSNDPSCGWNATGGFYDCGTSGGADPSGQHPKACGGCTPDCTGKVCGDDGCGGSCGTCPPGQSCEAGQCVQSDPCKGITIEGCCDGNVNWWCEDNHLFSEDCSKTNPPSQCGWLVPGGQYVSGYYCGGSGADPSGQFPLACPTSCTPDCTGKVCGDDGCGGSCGTCPAGQSCQAGQCVGCIPDCTGKACGEDGCGGSCGTCPAGQSCQAGQCVGCIPDCTDRQCGNDGCGGSCGMCVDGETCQVGQCVPIAADTAPDVAIPDTSQPDAGCTPDCAGRQCGPDGCGQTCGLCPIGFTCSSQGQCLPQPTQDTSALDTRTLDTVGGDVSSADTGSGGKGSGGCSTSRGRTSWTTILLLAGFVFLALRRRAREA